MRQAQRTLPLVLLLAAGCRDAYHLAALRNALSREYREAHIGVSLTDGMILTVTFADGHSTEASCDRQAALALRVADFVRHNYPDADSLRTVSVAFTHRGSGDSRPTSAHLPFRFARSSLQAGLLADDSASAVALCELDAGPPSADSP